MALSSVYDFLYHDARRVGAFLAQLDPYGHLQSVKRSAQASKERSTSHAVKGEAGLPALAKLGSEGVDQATEGSAQSADRTYDPLWANALALLDHLNQKKLLARNIPDAQIGQFVVETGHLKVINLKLSEGLLTSAATASLLEMQMQSLDQEQQLRNKVGLQVLQGMPHSLQAHFLSRASKGSVSWMALEDENMVVPASTLTIKYGPWLDGEWAILGIKDAGPDAGPVIDDDLQRLMADSWEKAAEARHSTPLALLAELLAPAARQMMGRPGNYYGLTPILIFREVAEHV